MTVTGIELGPVDSQSRSEARLGYQHHPFKVIFPELRLLSRMPQQ
jgi:hypothetical protein